VAVSPPTNPGFLEPTPPDQPIPPPVVAAVEIVQRPSDVDLVDVLLIIIAGLASTIIAVVLGMMAVELIGHGRALNPERMMTNAFFIIPTQFVSYIIVVGFMAFLASVRHARSLGEAVHWNNPVGKLALSAVGAGAALGICSDVASTLLERWTPKSLPIEHFFTGPASGYMLAAFGVLVAPVVEELFFRGFVYPAVARWTGSIASILITAAAFASLHGAQLAYAWAPLLVLFVVGAVLTTVRARTGSVATCVLVHMGYNLVLFVILFFSTGGFHHMERI
jgi:CAAX protease family protein